jgi:O-antigen/teichoic acid export membrane protein
MKTIGPEQLERNASRVANVIRSALVWNFATLAFAQAILAAIFLILATRLEPATFGVFALASVITDIAYTLGTHASVDAIVRQQDFSRRTLSSVTWAMSAGCVALTAVLWLAAPAYAAAMDAPQLVGILEILTLSTLLLPFAIAPTAKMREQLDMKGLALLTMVSSLAGGGAALATSFSPWIEWSLVVQRLVTTASFIALAMWRTRTVPMLAVDVLATRTWFSSVSRIVAGLGIASITPRIGDILTGALFGPVAVGYLRVANRLTDLLLGLLVNPLSQLWVTLLSRTGESIEAKRTVFMQLSNLMALIALPGFVGLGLTAHEIVGLVLPDDYAPVAGPLTVLCVVGVFAPLTNPRNALFTALGRFNYLVWFAIVDLTVTVLGMFIMSSYGPVTMLSGGALASIAMIVFALPVILGDLKLQPLTLANHLAPPYAAVAVMAAAVLALEPFLLGLPLAGALMIKVAVGTGVYSGVLILFFRSAVMQTLRVFAAR